MFTRLKSTKDMLNSQPKLKRYHCDGEDSKKTDSKAKKATDDINQNSEKNIKNNDKSKISNGTFKKNKGFFDWLHNKIHHPFVDENGFNELLVNPRELHPGLLEKVKESGQSTVENFISPQAMQGRWQAYGQMRAARIAGRFALLTTGVLGLGLWGFQQMLSWQKRELDEKTRILEDKEQKFYKREGRFNLRVSEILKEVYEYHEIAKDSIKTLEDYEKRDKDNNALLLSYKEQLEALDDAVKVACGQDKDCHERYEHARIKNGRA